MWHRFKKQSFDQQTLAHRVLKVVLSSYIAVAFTATIGHILFEYADEGVNVVKTLDVYNKTFNSTIAASAWNFDEKHIDSTLKGMLELQKIVAAQFTHKGIIEKTQLAGKFDPNAVSVINDTDPGILTAFKLGREYFAKSFPVTYAYQGNDPEEIGTLTLISKRSIIFDSMKNSMIVILVNAMLKTLALSAIFFFAINRIIGIPMREITKAVNSIQLGTDSSSHSIAINKKDPMELIVLTNAFNHLMQRIDAFALQNKNLTRELSDLNLELEKKVRAKTLELQETQDKLLKAAHSAGMNQVASEVLHNAGNIINSVITTLHSLKSQADSDDIDKLTKITQILEQSLQSKDYSKIEQITRFLQKFIDKNRDTHEQLEHDYERIDKSVMHLKHITEMQKSRISPQTYEREFQLNGMLQEALHLSGLSQISTIQTEVIMPEEAKTLTIRSDEHKILQVLTNILINAKHAVFAAPVASKQIKIRVSVFPQFIRVQIEDNGVGIAPEDLPKLFQIGFTTKLEGSGFGLHNSANNMKSIGGSISGSSPGPMAGATFVVTIPRI